MKPRSIIALIVSAVLILGGIITCVVASSMAKSDGVMLFPEESPNGDLVYRMDLKNTTKITVNSADADISIVGGAERSVIEVVNFNANYYKLSQSNGSLTFGQVDDFLSMFKFWDNGFSFKGMRYLLRFGDDTAGTKKIIIKLSDADDIKLVNITSDTGDISVSDCTFAADYTLRADKGKVILNNIANSLSFNVSGKNTAFDVTECKTGIMKVNAATVSASIKKLTADSFSLGMTDGSLLLDDYSIGELEVKTEKGNVDLSSYNCNEGSVASKSGKVELSFDDTSILTATVTTKTGKVSVNGEFTDSFSVNSVDPKHRISIVTDDGDVYITHP
ncbi:MAG: DUF4097 domain-containing protein [Ruminococcaceae bacterium]|nr:DUF4097 domain-containing protein [Oscillospiraceae bacterium]